MARHFAPGFREWGESEKEARRLGLPRLGLQCLGHLASTGLWFYPRRLRFSIWRWEVCTSAAGRANLPRPTGAVTATYARHVAQSGAKLIFAGAARGRSGVTEPDFSHLIQRMLPVAALPGTQQVGVDSTDRRQTLGLKSTPFFATFWALFWGDTGRLRRCEEKSSQVCQGARYRAPRQNRPAAKVLDLRAGGTPVEPPRALLGGFRASMMRVLGPARGPFLRCVPVRPYPDLRPSWPYSRTVATKFHFHSQTSSVDWPALRAGLSRMGRIREGSSATRAFATGPTVFGAFS